MDTIALRFAENFAPECGTIAAHEDVIRTRGFVWYGKLGSPISETVALRILDGANPRVLLIHSGASERFWAHIQSISRSCPDEDAIPSHCLHRKNDFGCWFKVVKFEKASADVMSRCVVKSSGKSLSTASRHSMSPYFIIEYKELPECES